MNMEQRRELTQLSREELGAAMNSVGVAARTVQIASQRGTKTEMLDALTTYDKALAGADKAREQCLGFLGEEVEQWIGEV